MHCWHCWVRSTPNGRAVRASVPRRRGFGSAQRRCDRVDLIPLVGRVHAAREPDAAIHDSIDAALGLVPALHTLIRWQSTEMSVTRAGASEDPTTLASSARIRVMASSRLAVPLLIRMMIVGLRTCCQTESPKGPRLVEAGVGPRHDDLAAVVPIRVAGASEGGIGARQGSSRNVIWPTLAPPRSSCHPCPSRKPARASPFGSGSKPRTSDDRSYQSNHAQRSAPPPKRPSDLKDLGESAGVY